MARIFYIHDIYNYYYNIGASLSEPHVVCSTAEILLSVCRRTFTRKKMCRFTAENNLPLQSAYARGSHYTDKSSRSAIKVVSNLRVTMDNTVTNVTHSEARRQEKLRKRRERDRRRRAEENCGAKGRGVS